jgi:hypothetical protein
MITFPDHFRPQRTIISNLLLIEGEQPKTTYYCQRDMNYPWSKEELDEWYTVNFNSFPLYTSNKSDEVVIHNIFKHTYRKYHGEEVIKDTQKELRKEMDGLERDELLLDLDEYILEWIHNIFHNFAQAISILEKSPVFAYIHDDLVIMKNLLKFYNDIRKTDDIQLNFFDNLSIPKSVADQMTDVLIILLTDRIKMKEPDYIITKSSVVQVTNQNYFKIEWLASQNEFAELIHELTNKGYISLPERRYAEQARHLAEIFDFTASQRKANPNIAGNIQTVLKPIFDKGQKKHTYSYLKPSYVQKFNTIPVYISKKVKK